MVEIPKLKHHAARKVLLENSVTVLCVGSIH